MFDAQTAALIRRAPAIRGVDPAVLPQDLTRAYAELVALRLRQGDPGADAAQELQHDRLLKIATVYEALVDTAGEFGDRRGSAFVAGTAYQILGRVGIMEEVPPTDLLTPAAIHPDIAAPLLFLIAGQNPDAREAGRRLTGARTNTVLTSAMIETVADLASESSKRFWRALSGSVTFGRRLQPALPTKRLRRYMASAGQGSFKWLPLS